MYHTDQYKLVFVIDTFLKNKNHLREILNVNITFSILIVHKYKYIDQKYPKIHVDT